VQDQSLDQYRVLSEAETARLLGIHCDTLLRMSLRREGPPRIKLSPRRIGYRLTDVLAWLKACEAPTRQVHRREART
jgi:predicted DNA-binding transcriptional regulator AlpA